MRLVALLWLASGAALAAGVVLHETPLYSWETRPQMAVAHWRWVRRHIGLLATVVAAGPLGWAALAVLCLLGWLIVTVGNAGGFNGPPEG